MRIKKLFLLVMLVCCMTSQVMMASASTVRDDIKFLEETDNDIFSGVTDVVEDVGASGVRLVRAAGIIVMVISVLGAAIGLMIAGKGTDKSEKKARFAVLLIAGIIFFGGTALVIWAGDIGAAITTAAESSGSGATPTPTPEPTPTPTPPVK